MQITSAPKSLFSMPEFRQPNKSHEHLASLWLLRHEELLCMKMMRQN